MLVAIFVMLLHKPHRGPCFCYLLGIEGGFFPTCVLCDFATSLSGTHLGGGHMMTWQHHMDGWGVGGWVCDVYPLLIFVCWGGVCGCGYSFVQSLFLV